jgi:hypothetical protein
MWEVLKHVNNEYNFIEKIHCQEIFAKLRYDTVDKILINLKSLGASSIFETLPNILNVNLKS